MIRGLLNQERTFLYEDEKRLYPLNYTHKNTKFVVGIPRPIWIKLAGLWGEDKIEQNVLRVLERFLEKEVP